MLAIREVRELRGWTQTGLAKAAGVGRVSLNQIENGVKAPTVTTLEKLAAVLECEIADFFPRRQPELPLVVESLELPPDIAGYVRRFGLQPESYFVDLQISDPAIHRSYEACYLVVLRAEAAAAKGDQAESYHLYIGAADALNDLSTALDWMPEPERGEVRDRAICLYERVIPGLRAGVEMYEAAERRRRELKKTA